MTENDFHRFASKISNLSKLPIKLLAYRYINEKVSFGLIEIN
jgi:hypothetical protein